MLTVEDCGGSLLGQTTPSNGSTGGRGRHRATADLRSPVNGQSASQEIWRLAGNLLPQIHCLGLPRGRTIGSYAWCCLQALRLLLLLACSGPPSPSSSFSAWCLPAPVMKYDGQIENEITLSGHWSGLWIHADGIHFWLTARGINETFVVVEMLAGEGRERGEREREKAIGRVKAAPCSTHHLSALWSIHSP